MPRSDVALRLRSAPSLDILGDEVVGRSLAFDAGVAIGISDDLELGLSGEAIGSRERTGLVLVEITPSSVCEQTFFYGRFRFVRLELLEVAVQLSYRYVLGFGDPAIGIGRLDAVFRARSPTRVDRRRRGRSASTRAVALPVAARPRWSGRVMDCRPSGRTQRDD